MPQSVIVALISGRGSNLQAVIDATQNGAIAARIAAVISNEPDAAGLERARQAGIEAIALNHRQFPDRTAFETELRNCIDAFQPDLLILAGFMRILGPTFVQHYHGRMLNIHPSLLPKYRGLDTHARALAANESWHGASVHFVTAELDGGPVIVQGRVPVLETDTPDSLAARVLQQEHRIYPLVIRWFCEGRLRCQDNQVVLDGLPLTEPRIMDA